MATDEELLVMFSQPGTTRREALRAVYNAGLSRAADIAAEYSEEAREYRDNETDYPESWVGMQHHGMYHGARDVAIRVRAVVAEAMGEPHDTGSA